MHQYSPWVSILIRKPKEIEAALAFFHIMFFKETWNWEILHVLDQNCNDIKIISFVNLWSSEL